MWEEEVVTCTRRRKISLGTSSSLLECHLWSCYLKTVTCQNECTWEFSLMKHIIHIVKLDVPLLTLPALVWLESPHAQKYLQKVPLLLLLSTLEPASPEEIPDPSVCRKEQFLKHHMLKVHTVSVKWLQNRRIQIGFSNCLTINEHWQHLEVDVPSYWIIITTRTSGQTK